MSYSIDGLVLSKNENNLLFLYHGSTIVFQEINQKLKLGVNNAQLAKPFGKWPMVFLSIRCVKQLPPIFTKMGITILTDDLKHFLGNLKNSCIRFHKRISLFYA